MRVIIVGAGEVGFHLAKLLAHEGQDIVLIDKDTARLDYAAGHLDVRTVKGNSLSYAVLEEAGVSKANLLIALSDFEETNLTAAILAKNMGVGHTIARVNNPEFLHEKNGFSLRDIGIDEVISPEALAAEEIKNLLKQTAITDIFEFDNGALLLVGVVLSEESPLIGKNLVEAWSHVSERHFTNVAILRKNETILPRGDTRFEASDHVYFITKPNGVDSLTSFSGKPSVPIKDIIILGGSKVGINTAQLLQKKYNLKIIEQDSKKSYELAEMLPDSMVINGDGRDIDLLLEEGIAHTDAFIALTGNSEANIIASLAAKNHGASKTIALVENIEYIHLSQSVGIDTLINKKLIAANFIFRHVRKGSVVSLTSIHGVKAELLEFELRDDSRVLRIQVKSLNLPAKMIIGGVIRKGVGHAIDGDFYFMPRDRVVVLCDPESIRKVERFFQ